MANVIYTLYTILLTLSIKRLVFLQNSQTLLISIVKPIKFLPLRLWISNTTVSIIKLQTILNTVLYITIVLFMLQMIILSELQMLDYILFSVSFHFSSLFYLGLGWSMTSHVTEWSHHVMVIVTRSCDAEKIIKGSGIDDIIQYGKNMLVLWITYKH